MMQRIWITVALVGNSIAITVSGGVITVSENAGSDQYGFQTHLWLSYEGGDKAVMFSDNIGGYYPPGEPYDMHPLSNFGFQGPCIEGGSCTDGESLLEILLKEWEARDLMVSGIK